MRILMVSSYLPYPLFSGGHIRLYNLMKQLSKNHQITLICKKREHQTQKDVLAVEKICKKVVVVDRKKQWSATNILKTGLSFYPFLLVGHTSSLMKKRISEELEKGQFDVIHVETFYVFQNVPKTDIPVVLTEHNIEYLVYKRYAAYAPFVLKPLLYADIKKMQYWEKKSWQKATKLVAVSESDKKNMNRSDVVVVPNGVDVNKFKVQSFDFAQDESSKFKVEQNEKRVLFIGDFKWIQNRDALEWILKEIWPKISSKFNPSTSLRTRVKSSKLFLWIVGKNIPGSIKSLAKDPNIIFDENAPVETEKIFQKADLLLAPIRVGGGTQYKILESMATGVPVVTTRLGIEGLEAESGKHVLTAESSDKFVDQITHVLQNEKIYKNISQNARKLIEEKYDFEKIAKKLERVYQSVF